MPDVPKDYVDDPTAKCTYCNEEHVIVVMLQHPNFPEKLFCSHQCMERFDREHFSTRGWL